MLLPVMKLFRELQGGGEVSPRKSAVQSACQYGVTSRVSDFQNGKQSVIEETDKNFDLITEILLRFLGFEDLKVLIVIEKTRLVLFWNEMSSGVMNFKDSFLSSSKFYGQSYRQASAQQD